MHQQSMDLSPLSASGRRPSQPQVIFFFCFVCPRSIRPSSSFSLFVFSFEHLAFSLLDLLSPPNCISSTYIVVAGGGLINYRMDIDTHQLTTIYRLLDVVR